MFAISLVAVTALATGRSWGGIFLLGGWALGAARSIAIRGEYLDAVPPSAPWDESPWVRRFVLPAVFACFLYESVHDGDGVGLRLWGTSPLGLYAAGEDLRASSDPRWLWRDRLVDGLGVLVVFAPVAWCSARRCPFARWAAVRSQRASSSSF